VERRIVEDMPAEKPTAIQETICRLPPLNYSILIGAVLPKISHVKYKHLSVLARGNPKGCSRNQYWTTGAEIGVICVEYVTVRWTEVVHYRQIILRAQFEQTVSEALTLSHIFGMAG